MKTHPLPADRDHHDPLHVVGLRHRLLWLIALVLLILLATARPGAA